MRVALTIVMALHSSLAFAASEIVNSFDLGPPYYHAGSIAVAAYPHWRAVVMGPIPAVLGGLKYATGSGAQSQPGFKIVAIVEEDRPAHALMIAKTDYDAIAADPATKLPGQKLLLTLQSTAQMYAERCLAGWKLTMDKMTVVNAEEAVIRHGLRDKNASVAFVWSSFTYLAENDEAKAKALDCPAGVDVEIPTLIVARADLLDETDPKLLEINRRYIGTYVANFLGAWAKSSLDDATPKTVTDSTLVQSGPDAAAAKTKPDVAAKKLVATYAAEGIKVTDLQARTELDARRPPELADQLVRFTPVAGGVAPLAASLDVIIDFMVTSGSLKAADRPAASSLLDRSILDFIAQDPELGPIARGEK